MNSRTIGVGSGLSSTPDHSTGAGYESYLQGLGAWSDNQELIVLWTTSANEIVGAGIRYGGMTANGFVASIRAETGKSFTDNASKTTNPLFYDATKGACMRHTDGDWVIRHTTCRLSVTGLQLKTTGSDAGRGVAQAVDYKSEWYNCIMQCNSATGYVLYLVPGETVTCVVQDCLIAADGCVGLRALKNGASPTINSYNNTIVNIGAAGSTTGIKYDSGGGSFTNNIVNTAVAGFNTDCDWPTPGGSHNATDKSSSGLPSSNLQTSLTAATEWEGATTDFRVKSTSAKLKNLGTSGTGASTDIVGQARSGSATDIGAWEFQEAATFKLLTRVQAHGAFI